MRRTILSLVMVAAVFASACGDAKVPAAPTPVPSPAPTPTQPAPVPPAATPSPLPTRFIARNGVTLATGWRNEFAWLGPTTLFIDVQQRRNVTGIDLPPAEQWGPVRVLGIAPRDLRTVDGLLQFDLTELPAGIFRARWRANGIEGPWQEFHNSSAPIVVAPPVCPASIGGRPSPC